MQDFSSILDILMISWRIFPNSPMKIPKVFIYIDSSCLDWNCKEFIDYDYWWTLFKMALNFWSLSYLFTFFCITFSVYICVPNLFCSWNFFIYWYWIYFFYLDCVIYYLFIDYTCWLICMEWDGCFKCKKFLFFYMITCWF